MTKFIFSVCVLLSIGLIGCQNPVSKPVSTHNLPHLFHQLPTAMPTSTLIPIPTKVVDERADVMKSLILFNDTDNNFVQFIRGTGDVLQLDGNIYHVTFVSWTQTAHGLVVYNNAIINWVPPDNSYYDRLIEMKKAELYRIQHYSELTEKMLVALPLEDVIALQSVHEEFLAWQNDPRNRKPMELQATILTELDINPDDVNFMYIIPLEKPEENFNGPLAPEVHGL